MSDRLSVRDQTVDVSEISSRQLFAANSFWLGLREALGRVPDTMHVVRGPFTQRGEPAVEMPRIVRISHRSGEARQSHADAARRGLTASASGNDAHALPRGGWAAKRLISRCYQELARTRTPLFGVRRSLVGQRFEWGVFPLSSDGQRIDAALVLHDPVAAPDNSPSGRSPDLPLDPLLEQLIEKSCTALLFLSDQLDVLYASSAARRVIAETGIFRLRENAGLAAQSTAAHTFLQSALGARKISNRILLDDTVVRTERLDPGLFMTLRKVGVPLGLDGAVHEVFGLSAAETRIAVGIAGGATVSEIACQNGISLSTARTQLKSAMARMGVTRQQDLVRLMGAIAAT